MAENTTPPYVYIVEVSHFEEFGDGSTGYVPAIELVTTSESKAAEYADEYTKGHSHAEIQKWPNGLTKYEAEAQEEAERRAARSVPGELPREVYDQLAAEATELFCTAAAEGRLFVGGRKPETPTESSAWESLSDAELRQCALLADRTLSGVDFRFSEELVATVPGLEEHHLRARDEAVDEFAPAVAKLVAAHVAQRNSSIAVIKWLVDRFELTIQKAENEGHPQDDIAILERMRDVLGTALTHVLMGTDATKWPAPTPFGPEVTGR